jgi:hypothetical protein
LLRLQQINYPLHFNTVSLINHCHKYLPLNLAITLRVVMQPLPPRANTQSVDSAKYKSYLVPTLRVVMQPPQPKTTTRSVGASGSKPVSISTTSFYLSAAALYYPHSLWHWSNASVLPDQHNRVSPGSGEYIRFSAASYRRLISTPYPGLRGMNTFLPQLPLAVGFMSQFKLLELV